MAIVKWTPHHAGSSATRRDFDRLRNQMLNLFDQYRRPGVNGAGVFPALNISEDPDHLYVAAELPGIQVEDLNITVEKNSLVIRGERKIAKKNGQVNFHRRERESGAFRRIVSLPVKVDAENVSAVMKNGVLQVTLPKAAEVKPRQISILNQ